MVAYALVSSDDFFLLSDIAASEEWRAHDAELHAIVKRRAGDDAAELRCLRELERARVWQQTRDPGMVAYIERVCGYAPRVAYDRLRVARSLAELPTMSKALADGLLHYSMVRELTRVAVWETEEEWVEKAIGRSLREVEQMVRGRKKGDRPDAPCCAENIRHVIELEVSAETYALFRQAVRALKEETGERLNDDRVLAILSRRALQPLADGPRDQIGRMKCEDCNRVFQYGGGAVVEISAAAFETAECTGDRIDAEGKITRHVPEATRRAVRMRDHDRCIVPWCRSTGDTHLHHVHGFARGGNHAKENLLTLCWSHHRDLHDEKLRLTFEDGVPKFTRLEPRAANDTATPSIVEHAIVALVGLGSASLRPRWSRKRLPRGQTHDAKGAPDGSPRAAPAPK
jgi:hypothetical protein